MEPQRELLQTMEEDTLAKSPVAFEAYYRPLVHKERDRRPFYDCTVRDTYAVVSYAFDEEDSKTFCVKNIPKNESVPGKHAEIILIEKLQGMLEEKRKSTSPTKMTVHVYQNYSPCNTSGCCYALLKFKSDQKKGGTDVTMEVIFASLYNINRPKCDEERCGHSYGRKSYRVDDEISSKNKEGLEALNQEIGIRTFTKDDWTLVANALSTNNPTTLLAQKKEDEPTRHVEDKRMKEDLADIIGAEEGKT